MAPEDCFYLGGGNNFLLSTALFTVDVLPVTAMALWLSQVVVRRLRGLQSLCPLLSGAVQRALLRLLWRTLGLSDDIC